MIRVLFSVLAVVAAVLAIVLERPILYAAAAIMLLIVGIIWISVLRRRHREAAKPYAISTKAPPQPEENLKALGIMEIRPKEPTSKPRSEAEAPTAASEAPDPTPLAEPPAAEPSSEEPPIAAMPVEKASVEEASVEEPPAEEAPIEDEADAEALAEETMVEEAPVDDPFEPVEAASTPAAKPSSDLKEFVIQPGTHTETQTNGHKKPVSARHHETVLGPYLQALRAALDAHTVCMLKQEDLAFDYEVVTRVGHDGTTVHGGGVFSAPTPLLTASMTRQPVTVRRVDADDLPRSSLGYSATPEAVRQVALAPVPRPDASPETYFLLADTRQTGLFNEAHARTVLSQFARLLGTLLDGSLPLPPPAAAPEPTAASTTPEPVSTTPPRPRREIIAEEMQQARARDQLLALALVYLNRAEDIAETGEAAVDEAEFLLEARLRQAAHNGRVVRFGELTYGVFYDGDLLEVEAWGAQIQEALAEEEGLLEGGVSIGIALLQDRHESADAFRADATEALREAYETGTCTILE